jgi:hypothetical protein
MQPSMLIRFTKDYSPVNFDNNLRHSERSFLENSAVSSLKPHENITKNCNNVHIDINVGN